MRALINRLEEGSRAEVEAAMAARKDRIMKRTEYGRKRRTKKAKRVDKEKAPAGCPEGQQMVFGICREVAKKKKKTKWGKIKTKIKRTFRKEDMRELIGRLEEIGF